MKGRNEILKVHARNKKLAEEVDLQQIAMRTPGFSGADLANLLNEVSAACPSRRLLAPLSCFHDCIDQVNPALPAIMVPSLFAARHRVGHSFLNAVVLYCDWSIDACTV